MLKKFNRKERKDFFIYTYVYKRKVRKAVSTQSFANFLNLIFAHDKKILAFFAVKNSLHFNMKHETKKPETKNLFRFMIRFIEVS